MLPEKGLPEKGDLYKAWCDSPDETVKKIRKAGFVYMSLVGGCITGQGSLLSRLDPLSLVLHFCAVVIYDVGDRVHFGPAHHHNTYLFRSQFYNRFSPYKIMGTLLCLIHGDQYTVVIKETDRNFENVLGLGHYCVPWIFGSRLIEHLTLRLQQLAVKCGTKTKDTVFVNVVVLIRYHALADKARKTFYKLSNPRSQFQVAYAFEVRRVCVPMLNLDDAFEQKDDIGKIVEALKRTMSAYGFKIVRTLIVDTELDEPVKRAMTEIKTC